MRGRTRRGAAAVTAAVAAAIQAATVSGADLMGLAGKAGCVSQGCYADLAAVPADPLARIEALEHVDFVMKGGVVYKGASSEAP